MDNETIKLNIINGIYDIEPLIRPALSNFEIVYLFLLILSGISITSYYAWSFFYSCKGKAKLKIKKLNKNYSQGKITEYNAVYQAYSILQQGLKIKKITKDTPLPTKLITLKSEWVVFMNKLSYLRFSTHDSLSSEIPGLVKDCAYWLKKWP